ncbi:N-acetylneuraminate synthase family protein [Porticoccaceae bacterium]|nr:N-acetylneuraminate synthase family protein [Porticoccaceae bacterium]
MSANIIAEIGINHKGCMETAKRLIDMAASTDCWGVKFQYRHLESFYASSREIGDGIIIEELNRVNFRVEDYVSLAKYSKSLGLKVGISFFRIRDLNEFASAVDYFDFLKVPSAESTNTKLIEALLETNKQVMVSTGGHSADQIENALSQYVDKNIVIFHCVANYPAKLGSQSLNFIEKLRSLGFKEVGYSSHDENIEVCLIALSMGINWLERHLTENTSGAGLDDSSSSEIKDFIRLSDFNKKMEGILGTEEKLLNQGEILNMQNLGTGLYARKNLSLGSKVRLTDFDIKAPRVGLSVGEYLREYDNKILLNDIKQGMPLEHRAFKKIPQFNENHLFSSAKKKLVGIPVRIHDFAKFKSSISTGVYEFHLSYQECMDSDLFKVVDSIEASDHISIHLPDYIPGNLILDPISLDAHTRSTSIELIDRVCSFADLIRQKIGKDIPIVGSFSQTGNRPRELVLDELFAFLETKNDFNILPQWLPVYAWYFGGAVKLDLFNSEEDIKYIVNNKKKICLDLCHLALSARYAEMNWRDWYKKLAPFSGHLHLADAQGVDGEGLALGMGDIGDFSIFLNTNGMKIIEVWQGHFNDGEGFKQSLSTLFPEKFDGES